MQIEIKCQQYGHPDCLEEPDERFTMTFDDIGEPPIHWCSNCGQLAKKMQLALEQAIKEGGPEFATKLERLITDAEVERSSQQS